MITRVRVEASAKTKDEVKDDLVNFIDEVRTSAFHHALWTMEHELEVQSTKDGYWGRIIITREGGANG